MQINSLQTDLEDVYNDSNFIVMLESHLNYFRASANVGYKVISEHQSFKFEGDFYGLLNDLGLDKKHHYIVMRLNGLASSSDYKGSVFQILIPDLAEVNLLKNIYMTRNE